MLLAASTELGGSPSKDECLNLITERRWFNKDLGQDLKPYPGSSTNEPRWKTLFAWARNDAADHDCIRRGDHGFWPITKNGRGELARQKCFLAENRLNLGLLFLTTETFKRYLSPAFTPSNLDLPRPASIYEDDGRHVQHNIHRLLLESL